MALDPNIRWSPVELAALDLTGRKAAIVGGTGGLGRAVARALASRGASVLVVGQTFRDEGVPGIEFVQADLGLMREAQRVGRELPAEDLDLLVLTTGIFAASEREETPEGLERDLAVSYLDRLVLLEELAPRLREHRGVKPRVFVMGYPGNGQLGTVDDLNAEKAYASFAVHMNTVAGNEALVLHGPRRWPHVAFFGLNPGLVKTNIRANRFGADSWRFRLMEWVIGLFTPTPEAYAATITPLLVSPDLDAHSGAMFDQKGRAIQASAGMTPEHVAKLIAASEALAARALAHQPPRPGVVGA